MKLKKKKALLGRCVTYLALTVGALVVLMPFYITVITAFKTPEESAYNFFAFPKTLYLENFKAVFQKAAYIDGCSTVNVYVRVVLPLLKPMTATVLVLNALWVWNDFQMPLMILNKLPDTWTLPLFQYNFKSQYSFDYNMAFASYLIAMVPVLIAYIMAQKNIVDGLTAGAVKS